MSSLTVMFVAVSLPPGALSRFEPPLLLRLGLMEATSKPSDCYSRAALMRARAIAQKVAKRVNFENSCACLAINTAGGGRGYEKFEVGPP